MTIAEAIEAFKENLAQSYSPHTVKAYTTPLTHFADFLQTDPSTRSGRSALPPDTTPVSELTVDEALRFIPWLANTHFEGKIQPATQQLYLTAIRTFYSYVILHRLIAVDPADYERLEVEYRKARRRRERRLPKVPAESAVERLVAAARAVPPFRGDSSDDRRRELIRLRDIAILELLRYSGIRVGELVSLRRGDVNYADATMKVRGKGGKERMVPVGEIAVQAIRVYLSARQDGAQGQALETLPLFARHDRAAGDQVLSLSTWSVEKMVTRYADMAGLSAKVRITPHSLRHHFATRVLEATDNLAATQELLGHSSPVTTRVYAEVTTAKKREVHRKTFGEKSDS